MAESPIFIVGAPRSGTSLLRNLLRSHPRLAFHHETHFVPSFYRAYGDPRSERAARRLAARILGLGWVRQWDLDLEPSSLAHHRSYVGLVSAIYEEMARRAGKPRWGDKTPQYVQELPTLHELFPNAKFLHIYRDGRDVALSMSRVSFAPTNVYSQATAWRTLVRAGRRDGARLPDDSYAEVRYETLIESSEEVMRRVCDFVGEPFTDQVLRPTPPPLNDRTMEAPRARGSHSWDPEIARGNLEKWRQAMPPADRALFETVAGDLLEELGYETEGLRRRISVPARLGWRIESGIRSRARRLARRARRSTLLEATVLEAETRVRARLRRR